MAETRLVDIYNPLVFEEAVDEAAIEQNALLRTGVITTSDKLNMMATVGGNIGEMPFNNKLSTSGEPNYTTDNPAVTATPDKLTQGKMIYRLASMHKSWSTMDLARELALVDPLAGITTKIGGWWATQIQRRVVNSGLGILADNVANDSSDMVVDIATDDVAAVADAERISANAILDAKQTMGDAADELNALAMHSVLYTRLQKQNLIVYIPNARGEVVIPTYLGYLVIVDDNMPAVAGTNRITYTVMLLGTAAYEMGAGKPEVPSELERDPNAGNGGGQDTIHSRRSDIIHPYGFQFTSASVAGQSATLTELGTAANWDRVVDRKNVGMAFLKVND